MFFCCTEQYYMFYKARVFNDQQAMNDIMRTRDPKLMKRIGSKVIGFDQSKWFKISIQVDFVCIRAESIHKLTSNELFNCF